jgi:WD40 repeat protein
VTACALSADGKLALSASADGKLCLWNTNSGQRIHIWKVSIFTELADCVLSADGRRIFAVFNPLYGVLGRARLQVWDATTGRRVRRLKGFKGAVVSCALSADGRWALTGSETTMMSTTLEMRVWEWGPTGILALFGLFRFLVDFEGSTLRLWDTESGETRRILRGHRGSVMFCALSADGRLALSASSNLVRGTPVSIYDPSEHQTLRLWDTASEIAQSLQERHAGPIQDCALSADGRLALTCAKNDKTLRLWDTERGTTVCILQGHLNQVGSCALSADGRLALSSATDVSLWNTTSGERRRIGTSVSVPYSSSKAEMIRVACALSSDGKLALSLRRGIGLCLWDTSSGKVLHVLGQANNLDDRTLSADGRKVLTISEDGVMRLWDTASGQEITQWIHNVPLLHCALSADGRRALTTSKDGNLQLWDTDSRRTQPSLEHYIGSVTDCALSADGHLALFACQDTTLRFWNMESGQEIACWTHDIPIVRCGLSANGRIVVAGDIDGGVHFLEVVGATKAENVSAKPYAQLSEYISPDSSTQQSGYPPANPYTQRTLSPHPPQHAPVRVNKPGSGCGALAGLILSICISIWTLPLPRLLPLPWYLVASVGILLIIVRSALERRSISRGGMALASLTLSIIVLVLTLCNFALGVSLGGR